MGLFVLYPTPISHFEENMLHITIKLVLCKA